MGRPQMDGLLCKYVSKIRKEKKVISADKTSNPYQFFWYSEYMLKTWSYTSNFQHPIKDVYKCRIWQESFFWIKFDDYSGFI